MSEEFDEYASLIERFLGHELSLRDFRLAFMDRFQDEVRELDEPLFLLLDELFGDLDACTSDARLLAEDPGFYLDEKALRLKARDALGSMRTWHAGRLLA